MFLLQYILNELSRTLRIKDCFCTTGKDGILTAFVKSEISDMKPNVDTSMVCTVIVLLPASAYPILPRSTYLFSLYAREILDYSRDTQLVPRRRYLATGAYCYVWAAVFEQIMNR